MQPAHKTQWTASGPLPLLLVSLALFIGTFIYWYWARIQIAQSGRYARLVVPQIKEQGHRRHGHDRKTIRRMLRVVEQALAAQQWRRAIKYARRIPVSARRNALLAKARFGFWRQQGERAQQAGDLAQAVRCYGKAISFWEDAALRTRLQRLDALLEERLARRQYYQQQIAQAAAYEKQGAWDQALALYRQLQAKYPQKQLDTQIKHCRQALANQQRYNQLVQQAQQAEQKQHWRQAVQSYQQLAALHNDPAIKARLAFCRKQLKAAVKRQEQQQRLARLLPQLVRQKRWARICRLWQSVRLPSLAPFARQACQALKAEMTLVPAGPFIMGDDRYPEEAPRHKVELPAYYIDRYEVTNQAYQLFIQATDTPPPLGWSGRHYPVGKARHPVVGVTALQAQAYAQWIGKQLPTEEQWEKAARGPAGRIFPWGNQFEAQFCNTFEAGRQGTVSVGSFARGVSPYGCYDMAGNALEWTSSIYAPYPGGHTPPYAHPELLVARGGSWYYHGKAARCSNRFPQAPQTRLLSLGFRCVLAPDVFHIP